MISKELVMARIMLKLTKKNNWGACYDRLEHFKRFPDLKKIIKELEKKNWVIVYNKPKYVAISLNTKYKQEIAEFIINQVDINYKI